MSWNGATGVDRWELLAGSDAQHLVPIRTVPKTGFETAMRLGSTGGFVSVRALDRNGQVLGSSPVLKR